MPQIEIDRSLFRRLVNRWYKLEIEHRGFRALLEEAKRQDSARSADIEAMYQVTTDSLRHDPEWIEFDSELDDALAIEDDETFLRVLDLFLSRRETGQ